MKPYKILLISLFAISLVFAFIYSTKFTQEQKPNTTEVTPVEKEITPPEQNSDTITLHIPIVEDTPKQHLFFHDLLKTVLEEDGHKVELITKKEPQLRIKEDFDNGELSIYWMVESSERNENYTPIKVGLTNGLIGNRILFIKDGDQELYDNVKTLDDFRELDLIGGMGEKWFDVKVWEANNLPYKEEPGNWQSIFKKIPAGRDYNYFSRGANEILVEAKEYPELAIEKNLVLVYDRDFRFYLSKSGPNAGEKYIDKLESAFEKAQASGTIDKMVRKYWGKDLDELNYDNRIKIPLTTPK